ncbi:DUF1156 domain-containing protein [Spirulina subsalsa FACHB-351]|uniref:DUF1156 domain-containing protein n=1 Tax=Spirulina subsalsa FACHB-351 TaxID=234711 RepID=A0ABT3LA41_9CYAN|nr:DUF1156 domain-containing protein [Spirulina subsalsa]MCW6038359.1 DUF1156 domain-containing protein [Spirulina subsalsa FACHB-351]
MKKKLIEVALPLEAINMESAREKSIRHGHPSTLHLWWARRPLAACRAVLWASLVDDPSSWPDRFPTEEEQTRERQRLFDILGRIEIETDKKGKQKPVVRGLVSWNEVNDPHSGVVEAAQREIARCLAWERGEEPPTKPEAVREYIAQYAPPAYDPFAGGGSIPLEAQRLGLEAHASDLNPVAVLINKALIEIPPKFKDQAPINGADRKRSKLESWKGAQGLAADVRFYGQWMREQAFERIGHLYPQVQINPEGTKDRQEATVIAWLWARTVQCPNPACGCAMPLVRSFQLSTKKGKEAWVEPMVEEMNHKGGKDTRIRFVAKSGQGKAPDPPKTGRGATFSCLACGQPTDGKHIKAEGMAGRMDAQLMAIVAEGKKGRIYLSPTQEHEEIARSAKPTWYPDGQIGDDRRSMFTPLYGLTHFHHLFTPRQLVALTTFSDLVGEAREKAIADAVAAGLPDDDVPLAEGGTGARAYGDAISVYLAFGIDRLADRNSAICSWDISRDSTRNTFGRQAIPMVWDFVEANPMSDSTGNFNGAIEWIVKVLEVAFPNSQSTVHQHDATTPHPNDTTPKLISTDPPYCLAPDTLIQTTKGYVSIQDIQIGDQVLTHKGQFSTVINTSKRWYEGQIYHLTIAGINHPLIITGEHPIYGIQTNPCGYQFSYCHPDCSYIKSQGRCRHQAFADYHLDWIPTAEVKPYDLIFLPTLTTEQFQSSIVLQDWLPQGDYLEHDGLLHYQKATPKSLNRREKQTTTLCLDRQYTIPSHLKITPALCRLIGFFIAEGYARLESDGGTIQFTLHWEEQNLKEDIIQLMQICFHLSPGKTTDNRKNNNNSFRLNFYSKPIATLFRTWFYTEDNHKCLPKWILELPTEFLEELIKGYWWGDGYRANNGYKAVTVSPALAGQIQLILQKLGIRSCLHTRTVKTTIVNGNPVIARYPQHNITVNGQSLLKLAEHIGEPKHEPLSLKRFSQHGYWWNSGYLVPIRKIEKKPYTGYVYNFETLDHSYTTATGCVHNCDNIGYADLSDFFYVWLRRSLGKIYPNICSTLLVPKTQELVSTPYRFEGSKKKAKDFFEEGIKQAFSRMKAVTYDSYPVTIFYAFKQQEEEGKKGEEVISSTGWETMLEGLIQSGLTINGTWPMRSELSNRMVASGTNALASSIVLVCRPRPTNAPQVTRRQFLTELKRDLPQALKTLQQGNIAPVDLAQASIGPGMAIYSQYAAILGNDGTPLPVRTALQLINQFLDEYLTEQEGEFDSDTRWTLIWFEQHQFDPGQYGDAETLSKAKNTSIQGLVDAGVLEAKGGKVRLLKRSELNPDWTPNSNDRLPDWKIAQYLIHALDQKGETGAAELLAKLEGLPELRGRSEIARDLAYRLYSLCDRKGWTQESIAYNSLVISWPEICRLASQIQPPDFIQPDLF